MWVCFWETAGRGVKPKTQESELGTWWGVSPHPVFQMAWKAWQKPFVEFFLSRLWLWRKSECGFISLGSRKRKNISGGGAWIEIQSFSPSLARTGLVSFPEIERICVKGMGAFLCHWLSGKWIVASPTPPTPPAPSKTWGMPDSPMGPQCLQVSSLPYFSLEFFPWIHVYPCGHLCSDTVIHSHLYYDSMPWLACLYPAPCTPLTHLHAPRSVLHFSLLLQTPSVSRLPWGLSPSFSVWYLRLSIIWPLLSCCDLERIILIISL